MVVFVYVGGFFPLVKTVLVSGLGKSVSLLLRCVGRAHVLRGWPCTSQSSVDWVEILVPVLSCCTLATLPWDGSRKK